MNLRTLTALFSSLGAAGGASVDKDARSPSTTGGGDKPGRKQ